MVSLHSLCKLNANNVIQFLAGFKCPVCSKFILLDDFECHIVMCLTKPRLSYNGKWREQISSACATQVLTDRDFQRTCWLITKANVRFAWTTWTLVTLLRAFHVYASITKSKHGFVQSLNADELTVVCLNSYRCIDRWFEVNRSCPEHPFD